MNAMIRFIERSPELGVVLVVVAYIVPSVIDALVQMVLGG